MDRDTIIEQVEDIFSDFITEEDENEEEEPNPDIIQFNIWDEDETCKYISFTVMLFDDNLITIEYIENCGKMGIGTIVLDLIEQLAYTIESRAIELIDHSKIIMGSIEIPLSILNTLKTGQSWYNAKGYICKNLSPSKHIERITKNTLFIQSMHMNEIGIEPELLSKLYKKNPLLDPILTIQSYFVIVSDIFKNWKGCKYLKLLASLIDTIDKLKVMTIDCQHDAMIKQIANRGGIITPTNKNKQKQNKTNQIKKIIKKQNKSKKQSKNKTNQIKTKAKTKQNKKTIKNKTNQKNKK